MSKGECSLPGIVAIAEISAKLQSRIDRNTRFHEAKMGELSEDMAIAIAAALNTGDLTAIRDAAHGFMKIFPGWEWEAFSEEDVDKIPESERDQWRFYEIEDGAPVEVPFSCWMIGVRRVKAGGQPGISRTPLAAVREPPTASPAT